MWMLAAKRARQAPLRGRPMLSVRSGRLAAALVDYADDKKLTMGPTVEDLQDLTAEAVRQGAIAKFRQARALLRGRAREGQPERVAMGLLESAAEDGMPEAANDLGLLLYRGRGSNGVAAHEDKVKAARLFEFAAREGIGKAAHNIGFMLHRGDGVAQNKPLAAEFFEMAAQLSVAKSALYLGIMFEKGDGVRQDAARAKQLFDIAEQATSAKKAGA